LEPISILGVGWDPIFDEVETILMIVEVFAGLFPDFRYTPASPKA
jgi:hypothetical protein